jgi:hypothetical protein
METVPNGKLTALYNPAGFAHNLLCPEQKGGENLGGGEVFGCGLGRRVQCSSRFCSRWRRLNSGRNNQRTRKPNALTNLKQRLKFLLPVPG